MDSSRSARHYAMRVVEWLGDLTGVNSGEPSDSPAEERLRLGLRRLSGWLLIGLGLGIWCVADYWHTQRTIALLWGLSLYAAAFFLGFLFGIPRVLQGDEAGASATGSARLRVNTNLEQVSDWLVKILIGLGLTELKQIGAHVYRLAAYVAPALYPAQKQPLSAAQVNAAGALVVYFSVLGFFSGYLITRLLLGTLFRDADARTISPSEEAELLSSLSAPSEPRMDMKLDLNPKALPAAQKLEKLTLSAALQQGIQPEALAVAKLNAAQYDEAIEAYRAALARSPGDPGLLFSFALALHQAGKPTREVVDQLERARSLLRQDTGRELAWQIYRYLTFFSLYLPAPESFQRTIAYGTEYVSDPSQRPSAAVYLNLACAYGQAAKAMIDQPQAFGEARDRALAAAKKAVEVGSARYKARVEQLLHPSPAQKSQGENDLEPFAGIAEFEQLVL